MTREIFETPKDAKARGHIDEAQYKRGLEVEGWLPGDRRKFVVKG